MRSLVARSTLRRSKLSSSSARSSTRRSELAFTVVTTSFKNLATFEALEEAEEFAMRWMMEYNPPAGYVFIQDNETGMMTEFGCITDSDVIIEALQLCATDNCVHCQAGLNAEFIRVTEAQRSIAGWPKHRAHWPVAAFTAPFQPSPWELYGS